MPESRELLVYEALRTQFTCFTSTKASLYVPLRAFWGRVELSTKPLSKPLLLNKPLLNRSLNLCYLSGAPERFSERFSVYLPRGLVYICLRAVRAHIEQV